VGLGPRGRMAIVIFLGLNGRDLEAPEDEVVTMMVAAAGRRRSEKALAYQPTT